MQGGRHLGLATALVDEMPYTLAALECGALSQWRATLIVRESACLSVEHRRRLDVEICRDAACLAGWGDKRIAAEARKIACALDVGAVVDRSAKAAADRCVTIRPALDTMTWVTALLLVAQGVSGYAALKRAADSTFDDRSRGQVMADTMVERITGRPVQQPVSVTLNLVMADTTLAGDDDSPAWLDGYGPLPSSIARVVTGDAVANAAAKAMLRRLYRHPRSGQLVAMESQARAFPKGLTDFIGVRHQTCRTPYCNAPIRHRDHAVPRHRARTHECVERPRRMRGLQLRQGGAGWSVATGELDGIQSAEFTTPTGATYRSTAPPLPGPPMRAVSVIEGRLSVDLITFDAAA